MAIFELSGVDYLRKQLKLTLSRNFEISEKYYVCVLNFCQLCFWENFNVAKTALDTNSSARANMSQKVLLEDRMALFY